MKLSIDLNPQISEQLAHAARIRGTDPTTIVESLVAQYLPSVALTSTVSRHIPKYKTPEEHIAAMDAIAVKNAELPILPDSAFDRESIYEDRL